MIRKVLLLSLLSLATLTLATTATTATAAPPLADAIPGTWNGKLVGRYRFVLHVQRDTNGMLRATADSPDQGATDLPVDEISTRGDSLVFVMNRINGWFGGVANDARTEIHGTWKQGTAQVALTLTAERGGGAAQQTTKLDERPQNPKPPFPYDAIEVTYSNPKAKGVKLAGTLTVPKGATKAPCAVLITGSGQEDRDETVFGHKPFLVLADYLTRHGIAVLRSDDRGMGGSVGATNQATSDDFASDIEAAVAFLKTRKEVDPAKIGLIGHSEGALIGPLVASRDKSIAFVVMLAGPGLPGDSILIRQSFEISRSMGLSDSTAALAQSSQRELIEATKGTTDSTVIAATLRRVIQRQLDRLPEDVRNGAGPVDELVTTQMQILRSPWMRFFLNHDPRPTLMQVQCPVLALNGDKDIQISAAQNLPEIRAALQKGGNKDVTVETLPNLNHLFQTSQTGALDEYATNRETFAPSALEKISDWVGARVGRAR